MRTAKHITLIFLGWVGLMLCTGCSTHRNTRANRAYHELTTRYNVYYNAEKAYHDILDEQLDNFQDDFSRLLPFYPPLLGHLTLPDMVKKSAGGPFDPVIEKMEKAIREHSISAKPRRDPTQPQSPEYRQWLQQNEFNPFIHHAWLLMGKAHLQNGNHAKALAMFNETVRLFGPESDAAIEAHLWIARCYIDMDRMLEAEQALYALKNMHLPVHLNDIFSEIYTYYLIQEANYSDAIPHLKRSIDAEKRSKMKNRWQFLLAQLYILESQPKMAHDTFNSLKGLATPREFVRNATAYQNVLESNIDSLVVQIRNTRLLADRAHPSLDRTVAMKHSSTGDTKDSPFSMGRALDNGEPSDSLLPENHWNFFRDRWIRSNRFHHAAHHGRGYKSEPPVFSEKRDTTHLLMLLAEQQEMEKEPLLFATALFNFEQYQLRTFELAFTPLMEADVLTVQPFRSYEEANRYVHLLRKDSLFLKNLPHRVVPIVISEENWHILQGGVPLEEFYAFMDTSLYEIGVPKRKGFQQELMEDLADEIPVPTISLKKESEKLEKIVPLKTASVLDVKTQKERVSSLPNVARPFVTPWELIRRLEEKEAQAVEQAAPSAASKSREQLLKERERQRQEKIRQRERALKERQKEREARLKQRERERQQQIKQRQQNQQVPTR